MMEASGQESRNGLGQGIADKGIVHGDAADRGTVLHVLAQQHRAVGPADGCEQEAVPIGEATLGSRIGNKLRKSRVRRAAGAG